MSSIKLKNESIEKISHLVANIYSKHKDCVLKLGINVEQLLQNLHITLIYSNLPEDIVALFSKNSMQLAINNQFKDDCSKVHFAIAHDIGHFVLDHEGTVFCKTTHEAKEKLENEYDHEEADRFAAALLIPSKQFADHYDEPLDVLAQEFSNGVSIKSLETRRREIADEMIAMNTFFTPFSEEHISGRVLSQEEMQFMLAEVL